MRVGLEGIVLVMGLGACGPSIVLESADAGDGGAAATDASEATDGPVSVPGDGGPGPGAGTEGGPMPADTGVEPTDGTTGDGADEGGSFLIDVDQPNFPPSCDPFENDCPAGQKCAFYSQGGGASLDSTQCVPLVANPDDVGEECQVIAEPFDGQDTCAGDALCWYVDSETSTGTCVAHCGNSPDNPTCEGCTTCTISGGPLALCLPTCDPVTQDCPEGQACYPWADEFLCAPDVSEQQGAPGTPCEFINVCDPGSFCLDPSLYPTEACDGASGCCTPTCQLGDPTACAGAPEGVQCVLWSDEGGSPGPKECGPPTDLGICSLP